MRRRAALPVLLSLALAAPAAVAGQAAEAAEAADGSSAGARPAERAAPSAGPVTEPFRRPPPELLEERRARLLEAMGAGVAVFPSAAPKDLADDDPQASSFRQDDDFLYLTGLETPHSWLLLARRPDGSTVRRLYVPERDTAAERWTGPRPGPSEAARISGIDDVRPAAELRRDVSEGRLPVADSGTLYLPRPGDVRSSGTIRELAAGASGEVRAVDPLMARLRLVKDEFELAVLRRAVEVTDGALRAAMASARPGMWEYELEAVVEYEFRRHGAERVGFPSIVGSGPNSVILHYDENRRKTEAGDLVVVDVGAEYSYYTADVTRTLPISGRFTDRQRALYELVLGAQRAGIAAVRPGARMADVERAARAYLAEHSGDLCAPVACGSRFVHGVGHWLGMDVHDVGSLGTPFRPGMVLTVEPGIYLPGEGLGIRIEDDVLVTAEGREVLSRAPKTVEEVEAAMRGAAAPASLLPPLPPPAGELQPGHPPLLGVPVAAQLLEVPQPQVGDR